MNVGATKAAKIANVARSTIYKDMDDGTLSFTLDGKKKRVIDVSELERVYGSLDTSDNKKTSEDVSKIQPRTTKKDTSDSTLSIEVKMLREQIERLDKLNDRERERLEQQIDDLKSERNKWQEQANKLLLTYETDKKTALEQEIKTKGQGSDNKALLWLLPLLTALFVTLIGFSVYVFAS